MKGGLKYEMEIQDEIDEYANLLEKIKKRIPDSNEALVVLDQIGRDKRTGLIQGLQNSNGDAPATDKQKNYLKDLGVEFGDSITKKEASDMIEQNRDC